MAQKIYRWFVSIKESRTDGKFEWDHGFITSTTAASIVDRISQLQYNRKAIMVVKRLVDRLYNNLMH